MSVSAPREPLVVLGLGCRLPGGGDGPAALWEALLAGVDGIKDVPPGRWLHGSYHAPGGGLLRTPAPQAGFVDGLDRFDADLFGISPREAALMDPQHRLLLEVAWEALEDAGLPPARLAGRRVGVFVGISTKEYESLQDWETVGTHTATGMASCMAANRISYAFDLLGPSLAVDTACSSSLVAFHLACQSVWRGESELALVGGVNALLDPRTFVGFSRLSMLSPRGRCRAFDAGADGFVRSEGAGVLVIAPASAPEVRGRTTWARVLATGVNQDGRSAGLTFPSEASQAALLRQVYAEVPQARERLRYVEAHGTGTQAGDPVEARALGTVLGAARGGGEPILLGSIKTNLGHLEAGAGVAGLIKACLALRHRRVPGNLHFERPNPAIPLAELGLTVPTCAVDLPATGEVLAGVNSFGFGGTNAHAVLGTPTLEGAPASAPARGPGPWLVPVSAHRPAALEARLRQLARADQPADQSIEALARELAIHRPQLAYRAAVLAGDPAGLRAALEEQAAASERAPTPRKAPGLAFVYSGQGPQWWGMGRQLLAREPVFRRALEDCDARMRPLAGWSLLDELQAEEGRSRLNVTAIAQPAIFALQHALTELWRSWGVTPAGAVGHSVGEVAAALAAGVLDLDQALRVIVARGATMEAASPHGRMLTATLEPDQARALLRDGSPDAALAAVNGPSSVTFSGSQEAMQALEAQLQARGVPTRVLRVEYAFHGPQMDPVRAPLLAALAGLRPTRARLPLASTVEGALSDGLGWGPDYWWRNVRQAVLFGPAVAQLAGAGLTHFLELGPHPVLAAPVHQQLEAAGRRAVVLPSLVRGADEPTTILGTLGRLWELGLPARWEAVLGAGPTAPLPPYPLQRERCWSASPDLHHELTTPWTHPLLGRVAPSPRPRWPIRLDLGLHAWLVDHTLGGTPLLPATAFLEIGLAAAASAAPGAPLRLDCVELARPCFPSRDRVTRLEVSWDPLTHAWELCAPSAEAGASELEGTATGARAPGAWTLHARGRAARAWPVAPPTEDLAALRARLPERLAGDEVYRRFEQVGLGYGSAFQGIQALQVGSGEALGEVRLPPGAGSSTGWLAHPALFDACLQTILGAVPPLTARRQAFLPVSVETLTLHAPLPAHVFSHVRLIGLQERELAADVRVLDPQGRVLLDLRGLRCRPADTASGRGQARELLFRSEWRPRPRRAARRAGLSLERLPALAALIEEASRAAPESDADRARERAFTQATDAVCAAWFLAALGQLGVPAGACTSRQELLERGVLPRYGPLLDRLADQARRGGWLEATPAGWRLPASLPDPHRLQADLAALGRVEGELLARCGPALADTLCGREDPLALLGAGAHGLASRFYEESQPISWGHRALAGALAGLPARVGRPLDVVEVGAGSGSLTRHALPALAGGLGEYDLTDVSPAFLGPARQRWGAQPGLRCRRLDVELDPTRQGFPAGEVDLVLGSQVVHATRDVVESLRHLRQLLAPGGLLALVEAGPETRWVDLVFGLTEGWWRASDERAGRHPLLGPAGWLAALRAAGFEEVLAHPRDPELPQEGALLLLARAPLAAPAAAPSPAATPGTWLLLADQGGAAAHLAALAEARGHTVWLAGAGQGPRRLALDPADPQGAARVLAAVRAGEGPPHLQVLDLRPLDAAAPDELTPARLAAEEQRLLGGLLHLLQVEPSQPARVWVVTRGAQRVDDRPVRLTGGAAWGLVRVASTELPGLGCRLVDLGDPADPRELAALVAEVEEVDEEPEEELALRGERRLVHRYGKQAAEPVPPATAASAPAEAAPSRLPFRLEVRPGSLELEPCRWHIPAPGPGEVCVQVEAAGLNFADVLKALGLYPAAPGVELALGAECVGTVLAVGPPGPEGPGELRLGERVMALGGGAFASHLVTPAAYALRAPTGVEPAALAGLPIVFLTALWALEELARVQPGERVLIHSATGGVGLAAIQVARRLGAEVLASAGTPEKRDLLRSLGVEHVFDSRSLSFADEVLTRTGGVDVVLNSLAGEAIGAGLRALRPFGRFVEIGKRDIYGDRELGLYAFRNNLSFHALDLDQALRLRPELVVRLLRRLGAGLADGSLRALPYQLHPLSEAGPAFRTLAQGRHTGKVVLDCRAPGRLGPPRELIRAERTYLVSGGLGGLGGLLAAWLVERGARHLVLIGRRGPATPGADELLAALRRRGCRVEARAVDVADPGAVQASFAQLARDWPPLAGVFHAAMVLDDGTIPRLDLARLGRVLAPKLDGAWNLHLASRALPLDLFVLVSSVAGVFGSPGQGNYAAANAGLDALAQLRRAQGLPGLAIDLGPLAEVGHVAAHEELVPHLEALGLPLVDPWTAVEAMELALREQRTQVGVMSFRWAALGHQPPRRFEELCEADQAGARAPDGDGGLLGLLGGLTPEAQQELLLEQLLHQLAQVLDTSPERIDPTRAVTDLGLDSLMALELRNWVEGLGLRLPAVELMRGPTSIELAAYLQGQLQPAAALVQPAAAPQVEAEMERAAVLDPELRFARPERAPDRREVVLLSGATGFLGIQVLGGLLARTRSQVRCLVRAEDDEAAAQRLVRAAREAGLPELDGRVRVVASSLGPARLGLRPAAWEALAEEVEAIYHVGAQVNFLLAYPAVAPANVEGTRELLRLASLGRPKAFEHVSSIAVFPPRPHGRVLESDVPTSPVGLPDGYCQSKWVAEALVRQAAERGLAARIYRPGVLAGHSLTGRANLDDLVLRLTRACLQLGQVPALEARLDVTPVDVAADALVHISLGEAPARGEVYHLASPLPSPIDALLGFVRGRGYRLEEVSYEEWVESVLAHGGGESLRPLIPAGRKEAEARLGGLERCFDLRRTDHGLVGSGLRLPALDQGLLGTYLGWLEQRGLLDGAGAR